MGPLRRRLCDHDRDVPLPGFLQGRPNQKHGYGTASAYMMRRRWDYFVKWLQGVEPPKEYQMK